MELRFDKRKLIVTCKTEKKKKERERELMLPEKLSLLKNSRQSTRARILGGELLHDVTKLFLVHLLSASIFYSSY